jgi:transposase
MARFHVGIDVGRAQHLARVLDTNTAHVSRSFQIPVSHEGFECFQRYLEGFSPNPRDFFVAIEATGAYHMALAGYLWDYGYTLALVNPARAKAFRKAEGHVAKTDRVDAGVLCRMISGVGLRPSEPRPQEQERLRILTRWYFRLKQEHTRALNRVSAAIDMVFPEFWQVFSEITQVTPRLVLQTYGTPDELVRADTEALAALLRRVSRGRYLRRDAEYLQTLASRTVGVRNLYAPVALQIRQALAQVDLIDQQIRELEPLIEQEFHAMGFAAEEFPIGGVTTIATIIAHLPSPQSTPSLKSLHAYVGWCPMDRQSGQYKSSRPRMAKGCPPLRWALHGLALASMPHVEGYKQYVTRRKSQGKTGGHILVIIGRKLLDHIWAIARTKDVFLPVALTPVAYFRREKVAVHV